MKTRKAWLWSLEYKTNGARWFGTCPVWAAQPVPEEAVLTRRRVVVVGPLLPCAMCGGGHPAVALPE